MQSLITAFKYLTILGRWRESADAPAGFDNAPLWFPLVGLVIGVTLAAINYLLSLQVAAEILFDADHNIDVEQMELKSGRNPSSDEILDLNTHQTRELSQKEADLRLRLKRANRSQGTRKLLIADYKEWLKEFLGTQKFERYLEIHPEFFDVCSFEFQE